MVPDNEPSVGADCGIDRCRDWRISAQCTERVWYSGWRARFRGVFRWPSRTSESKGVRDRSADASSRTTMAAPARGRGEEPLGRDVFQGAADALRHLLGRLDRLVREVDDAEHDGLAGELRERPEIELRLRGFDRDLLCRGISELRQERIAGRLLPVHD